LLQALDRADTAGGHAEQRDRLARQRAGEAQVVDGQLHRAADAAMIFGRGEQDAGRFPHRLLEALEGRGVPGGQAGQRQIEVFNPEGGHVDIRKIPQFIQRELQRLGRIVARPHAAANCHDTNRHESVLPSWGVSSQGLPAVTG
jgi:hypothetical protein